MRSSLVSRRRRTETRPAEFAPFVFQILSQLLELHKDAMPDSYRALIPGLLMAPLWTSRGNVPALVRLVRAFLAKSALEAGQLPALRDVLRFISSQKAHDTATFELAEALVQYASVEGLQPIMTDILLLMLTRLTSSKTPAFASGFLRFLCLLLALQRPGLSADEIIGLFNGIQPGYGSGVRACHTADPRNAAASRPCCRACCRTSSVRHRGIARSSPSVSLAS